MEPKAKRKRRADEPLVQKVFQRRGTVEILVLLKKQGSVRFSGIDTELDSIAPQVVSARLADLREVGMIQRTVQEGPPLTTTYSLTPLGDRLAGAAEVLVSVAKSPELPVAAA